MSFLGLSTSTILPVTLPLNSAKSVPFSGVICAAERDHIGTRWASVRRDQMSSAEAWRVAVTSTVTVLIFFSSFFTTFDAAAATALTCCSPGGAGE